eukprot:g45400.t1
MPKCSIKEQEHIVSGLEMYHEGLVRSIHSYAKVRGWELQIVVAHETGPEILGLVSKMEIQKRTWFNDDHEIIVGKTPFDSLMSFSEGNLETCESDFMSKLLEELETHVEVVQNIEIYQWVFDPTNPVRPLVQFPKGTALYSFIPIYFIFCEVPTFTVRLEVLRPSLERFQREEAIRGT